MYVLLAAVLFLAAFLVDRLHRDAFSPCGIVFLLWGVIVGLAGLGGYGMDPLSPLMYEIVVVGLFAFAIGAVLGHCGQPVRFPLVRFHSTHFKFRFYLVLLSISVAVWLMLLMAALPLLLDGMDMTFTRQLYLGTNTSAELPILTGQWGYYLRRLFLVPMAHISLPILVYAIFRRIPYRKWILLLSATNFTLCVFVTAGRMILVYFAFDLLLGFKLFKKQIPRKLKLHMKWILLLLTAVIVLLTVLRTGDEESVLEYVIRTVYIYLTTCMPLGNLWITSETAHHFAGSLAFNGAYAVADFVVHFLGISLYSLWGDAEAVLGGFQNFYRVYADSFQNAYVTSFAMGFIDSGWLGLTLTHGLWGWFAMRKYRNFRRYCGFRQLVMYSIVLHGLLASFVEYPFSNMSYVMELLIYAGLFGAIGKKT